ncbi:MAG: iron-sulfur cluster assembly scaffold protein [Acidobacteria bacterium]|nr:iron-sulfur cluster assembly scaffold protein [Acidobacteriota bacterium]MBV9436824.1 iron-sulfur cluster assembly scaffold protein [Acidobacteriota bacterium]
MYPRELLEHFEHPRNSGPMESPDVSVESENPACGDVMRLMLRVGDGRVSAAKYQVRGCVASIACGSALTEAITGKSLKDAASLKRETLVQVLGGLSNETMHASHLAMDCLRLALKELGQ